MASKSRLDRRSFAALLTEVKQRIQTAQTRALFAVNSELVRLYWDIGRTIDSRQQAEGWGSGVIPRLAAELKNELPEVKGFSERNIGRMIAFYRDYPEPSAILPQAAAKSASSLLWTIPWFHHVVLTLQRGFDLPESEHRPGIYPAHQPEWPEPSDQQEQVKPTVLEPAEVLSEGWVTA